MNTCFCGNQIEDERVVLGFSNCKRCAFKRPTEKVCGYLEWSHKTAPVVRLISREGFEQFKKDTNRVGQSSILRGKMEGGGRLM